MRYNRTPIIFWPFAAVWNLLGMVLKLTGRLVAAILGLVLLTVGVVLCVTVVGAIAGVPLAALGFTMIIRGFF